MQRFLNKRVSIRVGSLLLGLVILLFVMTAVGFFKYFYTSDNVQSLDCMTINRGYLQQVRELYSDRPDFESLIWPRAVTVGGQINTLCYESLENGGLFQ